MNTANREALLKNQGVYLQGVSDRQWRELWEKKQVTETLSIIEVAMRSGVFRSFTRLLEGSPLEKELNGEASYTLFAPADIAFAYLSPETIDQLLHAENQGILADVLGYHGVPKSS